MMAPRRVVIVFERALLIPKEREGRDAEQERSRPSSITAQHATLVLVCGPLDQPAGSSTVVEEAQVVDWEPSTTRRTRNAG